MFTRIRLRLRSFVKAEDTREGRERVRRIRPVLEALEDRFLLSADSLFSTSAASPAAEAASQMVSMMNQESQALVTFESELSTDRQMLFQEITQETAYFWQQWEQLLGIGVNAVAPQPSSSSGSNNGPSTASMGPIANQNGGGSLTDGANSSRQPIKLKTLTPDTDSSSSSPTALTTVATPQITPNTPSTLTGHGATYTASEGGIYQEGSVPEDSPLIQAVAGTALTNVPVTIFSDSNPNSVPSDFTATINWGDSTPNSSGTITTLQGGGFSVAGTHTYNASGTYSVQVTVTDVGANISSTGYTKAVVSDAPLTATAASINATENVAANNVSVASFSSTNLSSTASNFSATIDWGDGGSTSAGAISGSGGIFNVTGSHTYAEGGTYQVSVTIASQGGSSAAVASTATVADQPLTGTGITPTPAVTGSSTTLNATFTDANTSENPSNYIAQVAWGDGWTDDEAVSGSNGSYSLSGSHVYDHPGNYSVSATVTDGAGTTLTQTTNTTITAATLSATGATLTATSGQALSDAQIASFTDGNTDDMNDWYGPATGYTTSINWGDGTGPDTSATVTSDESGFYVLGNHTYSSPGAYPATVTITNADGVFTNATSTIDVTTITPSGSSFNASEGVALNNVTVATFTDTQADTYTASINWGDGNAPTTGVVSGSNGNYTVTGSHTYADGGTDPVTVTITNSKGLSAVTYGTATVADAALTATPQNVTTAANSTGSNLTLATFTDANPNDPLSSYSASIDWGDGSPTDVGTITYANGVYTVTGSHTYTTQGSDTATVSIADDGGATATASPTITVTAPVINASAVSLSAQEDVALTNVTVATFTAPGQASNYTATVDWGDGNTSTGTITGSGGNFSVLASNTYQEQTGGQAFLVAVTISDTTGDTATALSSATVDGGTLSPTGANLQGTEATSQQFTLATFTDTDHGYSPAEYTATVDWGDGNQGVATVNGSNGSFSVTATHIHAQEGSYTATVTLTDPNGVMQTVTDAVSVADAALTAWAPSWKYNSLTIPGVPINGLVVAYFTDPNGIELASAYTATINWGDGSGTTAGYVSGGGGSFSVEGSHTYTTSGWHTVTTTISDPGGSQVMTSYSNRVFALGPQTVATFSDSNTSDPASAFSASINWGDGTSATSGTVSGGYGSFTVTGSHIYAEEGTYAMSVTVSGPGGPLVIQSTAQVTDAGLLAGQAPGAPTPPPAPPAAVPTIQFDFGSAKLNKIAAVQGGLRIHIDDDFYMQSLVPGSRTTQQADNLIDSVNPSVDPNLVQGTITIGPAGTEGELVWTIPNSVRVWWQPAQNGRWQLVQSGGTAKQVNYKANAQPIPIRIQGISPNAGPTAKVTVKYEIAGQANTANGTFFYNVYTGLNVSGNAAPQQSFIQQLGQASSYGLTVDGSGNVWRTSEPAYMTSNQKYMGIFSTYLEQILTNSPYSAYTKDISSTIVTAVAVQNNTPGWFDDYKLFSFYPANIALVVKPLGDDGLKFAAAVIIHGLQEMYEMQINGLPFVTKEDGTPDKNKGGAFGAGVLAEQAVLGWGDRKQRPPMEPPPLSQNLTVVPVVYTDANNKVTTIEVHYRTGTDQLLDLKPFRPGQ